MKILIRGAGEIASGVAHRLWRCGFSNILLTEIQIPLAVRRKVSFSEAVFDGSATVEGLEAIRVQSMDELFPIWQRGGIAVIVDPLCQCIGEFNPDIVVDAILAKRKLGNIKLDSWLMIALGPGFEAGHDCHCVIETNRGHDLGRLITKGTTSVNTGMPGSIMGQTHSRVLRAPTKGLLETSRQICDRVDNGSVIAHVGGIPVHAQTDGILRGLLRPGYVIGKHAKIGDIDPRSDINYCHTISDKARSIGGSVLEAILANRSGNRY
jgi:xanthine dehydrogenase accessory factor